MSKQQIFSDFPAITKQQWMDKVIQDLKGADFSKKLVWNTYEGFSVDPFYTEEDVLPLADFTAFVKSVQPLNVQWINYAEVSTGSAQQQKLQAERCIQQGADGLIFSIDRATNFLFDEILASVDPTVVHISFVLSEPDPDFIAAYFKYLEKRRVSLGAIHGFCDADILEKWITGETKIQTSTIQSLARQLQLTKKATGFRGLTVRSNTFVDAGGNVTQELAFLLNKVVAYTDLLSDAGLSPKEIFSEVHLRTAINGDYFFEIAKLRSLRALYATLINHYSLDQVKATILSVSSIWSKSRYDAHTNMLRNTTEAMAAVTGGCDGLLIKPHTNTSSTPDEFNVRMALNVSNILKAESYFDQVSDAAGGAYYIEVLTHKLYENALNLFKEVEQEGGFVKAFEQNKVQLRIASVRDKKLQDIHTRKQVYVGINQYANPAETLPVAVTDEHKENDHVLVAQHATRSFEILRQRTQQFANGHGKVPEIFLLAFGNLAMRKARVAFSQNFFAAAGFSSAEHFHENPLTGIQPALSSDSQVIVLCASDDDYTLHAEACVKAFRKNNSNKILVLAGYPPMLVESLQAAGLDYFIHIKSNAVEVLSVIQDRIFAPTEKN